MDILTIYNNILDMILKTIEVTTAIPYIEVPIIAILASVLAEIVKPIPLHFIYKYINNTKLQSVYSIIVMTVILYVIGELLYTRLDSYNVVASYAIVIISMGLYEIKGYKKLINILSKWLDYKVGKVQC